MPPEPDSWETPPEGLIRGLMDRHGITREQAIRRIGLDPGLVTDRAEDLGLVPFRALKDGARFRLHGTVFRKTLPRVPRGARMVVDPDYDYDVERKRGKQRPNAKSAEPVNGWRHRLAYVRPDHPVEPVKGRAR
jgi:hypothetical protein